METSMATSNPNHEHALAALSFIQGECTEAELRAALKPDKDEMIAALKAMLVQVRQERDQFRHDLKAALEEIDRLTGMLARKAVPR